MMLKFNELRTLCQNKVMLVFMGKYVYQKMFIKVVL